MKGQAPQRGAEHRDFEAVERRHRYGRADALISMVVEGSQGAGLAIECDGDSYHGIDKFADDMQRQRVLKRAAGVFWALFRARSHPSMERGAYDLATASAEQGIEPIAEGAP